MADQPTLTITITGPQLRADRRGYVLGDERIDGFGDRPDLDDASRRIIAAWAADLGAEGPTAVQQQLLDTDPEPASAADDKLLTAALQNAETDMPVAIEMGLYGRLTTEQIDLVREPWRKVSGSPRHEYPLSSQELATLTGTSAKQIRSWADKNLIPSYRISDRRHFFSAATVHAFALSTLERNEVRAVARLSSAGADDPSIGLLFSSRCRARLNAPLTSRPFEQTLVIGPRGSIKSIRQPSTSSTERDTKGHFLPYHPKLSHLSLGHRMGDGGSHNPEVNVHSIYIGKPIAGRHDPESVIAWPSEKPTAESVIGLTKLHARDRA